MTFSTKKRSGIIAAAMAASLLLAACGGESTDDETMDAAETPAESTDEGLSGAVIIDGSSTVAPNTEVAAELFRAEEPGIDVSVGVSGTGGGFEKFCNGETDISDASRAISEEEIALCEAAGIEFIELQVAVDGLSVITSAQNDAVECLSFVDLYALLGPDATGIGNWADATAAADEIAATVTDLGAVNTPYPDAPLTVTAPGEESGTFDSFVELVIAPVGEALGVEDANVRPDYTASPNDNVIIEGIAANPTSLGWVGFAFVEENLDTIKPLQIDGGAGCIEPTVDTIASGEFPIARPLFIYVSVPALEANPALEAFVDFYVNEAITTLVGPDIEGGQVPYVPLADEAVAEVQGVWEARETGTREG